MVLSVENFPYLFADVLAKVYMVLTTCKLIQLAFCNWRKRQGKQDLYSPSAAVFVYIMGFFVAGGQHIRKIPRKDLRAVSDKWIQDYNQKHSPHTATQEESRKKFSSHSKKKIYKSKDEAIRDFFAEFTKDSSLWYVAFSKHAMHPYFRHPLGLCIVVEVAIFSLSILLLVLRETMLLNVAEKKEEEIKMEAGQVALCKVAAAATITELFVVACKEQMSFDKVLHAYPWVQHGFTRPQVHPMIGRAVCPAYQRKVNFPCDDVMMDFDIEILTCKSGPPLLRQKHKTLWGNLMEDLVLSYVLLICALLISLGSVVWYNAEPLLALVDLGYMLLPHAVMFYGVRTWSDQSLKIEWLSRYRFLP